MIELVCGHDPGAAGQGFAVWDAAKAAHVYIGSTPPPFCCGVVVVESGFIGKMGRQAMWGLGFSACWGLLSVPLSVGGLRFTIRPDGVNGWRAALPPRPDLPAAARFERYDGLPGDVIVARLRQRYRLNDLLPSGLEAEFGPAYTEHEVEACGIAEAAAAILQRPKAKDRRALKAVKR